MDKLKVVYVVDDTAVTDVLVGTGISYQRFDRGLNIKFPNGDGIYLQEFSKSPDVDQEPLTSVSYARCEKMSWYRVKPDTTTDPS